MSDHKGAVLLFDALPRAKELLGDKGYDSDWFRAALTARGITPCIPQKPTARCDITMTKRSVPRQRKSVERAQDATWRRIGTLL